MTVSVNGRVLDRIYQEDWRSLNFRSAASPGKRPRSFTWRCDWWLDQENEGACVGFGVTHELLARPVEVDLGEVSEATAFARAVYKEAQTIDEWAGEQYEGTSVLAGMKVLKRMGLITEYRWCLTMDDLIYTAGRSPVVIGVNWYSGMFDTDSNGFIHAEGSLEGGHCLLLNGVKVTQHPRGNTESYLGYLGIDRDKSYFKLHNSWGKEWGVNGGCKISFRDMDRLMRENGDFAVPTVRRKVAA